MSGKKRVPSGINKKLLVQEIIAGLNDRLEVPAKAAQASHAEATVSGQ